MKIPKIKAKKITWKSFSALAIFELILAVAMVYIFLHSVSINNSKDIQYAKKDQADTITCTNGNLCVNNIEVSVPLEDNPAYNISYSWAEEDTDYPSVPVAAIASFSGEDGTTLYDISLYKESFVPKERIPDNKNADNWFDDWDKKNEGSDIEQGKLNSGKIHGFFISSVNSVPKDESRSYANYSYYFVSKVDDGMKIYILEGTLYDPSSSEKFLSTMSTCIKNIKIVKAEEIVTSAL